MPDFRGAAQLNGLAMKGIVGSGKSFQTYYAACSSNLSSFTTEADLTGATVSVVVPTGGGTVIVVAHFDMAISVSGGATINGFLNWNTVDQTNKVIFTNGTSNNIRGTFRQTWILTGISAGTYTAKLTASSNSNNANVVVRATHTTIAVLVIGSS